MFFGLIRAGIRFLIESFVETFDEKNQAAVRVAIYGVGGLLILGVVSGAHFSEKRKRQEAWEERVVIVTARPPADQTSLAPPVAATAPDVTPEIVITPKEPSPDDAELAPAHLLIERAGQKWAEGDKGTSLVLAEKALRLFNDHLGDSHPKVVEVRAMVNAASQ